MIWIVFCFVFSTEDRDTAATVHSNDIVAAEASLEEIFLRSLCHILVHT